MANHGNSPAAWTAVSVCLVAFLVAGIGLMVWNWVVFWIGIGLIVLSLVVGKVMSAMGLGAHSS